jgi:predicted nucleic acid-binding protein
VVAWLVPSFRSESVAGVWQAYARGEDEFVAPPLLYPETLSAIRRLAVRGLLSAQEAGALVSDFLALDIPTPTPKRLYQRAYDLAARYQHSKVYDACYLALAELLSCELLTLDQKLYNAVAGDLPWVRLMA